METRFVVCDGMGALGHEKVKLSVKIQSRLGLSLARDRLILTARVMTATQSGKGPWATYPVTAHLADTLRCFRGCLGINNELVSSPRHPLVR